MSKKTTDWYPGGRMEQIIMLRVWLTYLNGPIDETSGAPSRYKVWGIPEDIMDKLGEAERKAGAALVTAMSEETRTSVINTLVSVSFGDMEKQMRDVKRRWFFSPPLTEMDIIALGLKSHDKTRVMSGIPTGRVRIETFLVDTHQLGFRYVWTSGSPDDPSNKSLRVYYKVVGQGEAAPKNPEELTQSFSTRRKKDIVNLAYEDSGKRIFFAVQVENGSFKGSWGEMGSAIIP
jgi:hypothetical protein